MDNVLYGTMVLWHYYEGKQFFKALNTMCIIAHMNIFKYQYIHNALYDKKSPFIQIIFYLAIREFLEKELNRT